MKILRSVTRRGFNVGTAGWFTVLRPNTWFPATRLQASQSLGRSIVSTAPVLSPELAKAPPAAIAPNLGTLNLSHNGHVLKQVWIVLSAAAITSALLLWIIQPR